MLSVRTTYSKLSISILSLFLILNTFSWFEFLCFLYVKKFHLFRLKNLVFNNFPLIFISFLIGRKQWIRNINIYIHTIYTYYLFIFNVTHYRRFNGTKAIWTLAPNYLLLLIRNKIIQTYESNGKPS